MNEATKPYFLKYQVDWIKDNSQFKLNEKSRRIGISYAQAYKDAEDLTTSRRTRVFYSSADLTLAEEYKDYIVLFAGLFNIAAEDCGEVVLDEEKKVYAKKVIFENGNEFYALSSNPSQFRGKGRPKDKFVLDEFAHHEQAEKLYAAVKPATLRGAELVLISTHNGDDSFFNTFCEDLAKGKYPRWFHQKITLDDAVEDGIIENILGHAPTQEEIDNFYEDAFSGMSQEAIDEEFYCKPRTDKSRHLLPYSLIATVEDSSVLYDNLREIVGNLYIGVDIGRRHDLTVIWILEELSKHFFTRKIVELKNTKFRDQYSILEGFLQHPNFRRACIDATGLGMQLAEDAAEDYGKLRVEEVTFTNKVKEKLANNMLTNFENGTIIIPKDRTLREDLYSVKSLTTAAGNVRYAAPTTDDGHADRFFACALALEAGDTYSGEIIVRTRGRRATAKLLEGYYQ